MSYFAFWQFFWQAFDRFTQVFDRFWHTVDRCLVVSYLAGFFDTFFWQGFDRFTVFVFLTGFDIRWTDVWQIFSFWQVFDRFWQVFDSFTQVLTGFDMRWAVFGRFLVFWQFFDNFLTGFDIHWTGLVVFFFFWQFFLTGFDKFLTGFDMHLTGVWQMFTGVLTGFWQTFGRCWAGFHSFLTAFWQVIFFTSVYSVLTVTLNNLIMPSLGKLICVASNCLHLSHLHYLARFDPLPVRFSIHNLFTSFHYLFTSFHYLSASSPVRVITCPHPTHTSYQQSLFMWPMCTLRGSHRLCLLLLFTCGCRTILWSHLSCQGFCITCLV